MYRNATRPRFLAQRMLREALSLDETAHQGTLVGFPHRWRAPWLLLVYVHVRSPYSFLPHHPLAAARVCPAAGDGGGRRAAGAGRRGGRRRGQGRAGRPVRAGSGPGGEALQVVSAAGRERTGVAL